MYIYTTAFVSRHAASYTWLIYTFKIFIPHLPLTTDNMVTDVTSPPAASHATGDKKPWRQTPLIESAKLSKEAGW